LDITPQKVQKRELTLSESRKGYYSPKKSHWGAVKQRLVYKKKSRGSLDVSAPEFKPISEPAPKTKVFDFRTPESSPPPPPPTRSQSVRGLLNKKSEGEKKPSPKAVVVAQFKEQTIEYKAKVDQLSAELHKSRGEAKQYKELASKLKDDLGALLKRSFHMLRDARDKAAEYKQQLDELKEARLTSTREKRLSMSSARSGASQGSSDFEILSMTSNNSAGRPNGYEPRIPPMPFADMPMPPWWTNPQNGSHPLFDELDEVVDAQNSPGREGPRRTIGPASPPFFEGQRPRASSKNF